MRENLDLSYMGNEEDEIYKLNILEHYKNPRNFGKLDNADITHKEINTTCGDEIQIFVKLDKNKKIKEARFFGRGCAISQAAASMLTEKVKGLKEDEIMEAIKLWLETPFTEEERHVRRIEKIKKIESNF